MKKAIAALLAAALLLSLAACGGAASSESVESTASESAESVEETAASSSETDDSGNITLTGVLQVNTPLDPSTVEGFTDKTPYTMSGYAISLAEPVTFELAGKEYSTDIIDLTVSGSGIFDIINANNGGTCKLTGYYKKAEYDDGEIGGPDEEGVYYYYPHGNYSFCVTSIEIVEAGTPDTTFTTPTSDQITITGTVWYNEHAYAEEIAALEEQNENTRVETAEFSIRSDTPVTFELNGEESTGDTFDIEYFSDGSIIDLMQDNPGGTFRLTGYFEPTEHEDGEIVPDEYGEDYSHIYYYPNGNYTFFVEKAEILSDPWTSPDAENNLPQVTAKAVVSDMFATYMDEIADIYNNSEEDFDLQPGEDFNLRFPNEVVTFDEPVTAEVDGKQVTIEKAALDLSSQIDTDFRSDCGAYYPDYYAKGLHLGGNDSSYELTGSFVKNENLAEGECTGPYTDVYGNEYYFYNPFEYTFYVTNGKCLD